MNCRRRTVVGTVLLLTDFVTHTRETHPAEKKTAERKLMLSLLREELNDPSATIRYKESGQPFVAGHPHLFISISHSNGWCALAVSEKHPVGSDIQTFTSRLERGMDYFVNQQERQGFKENPDLRKLYLTWCAKEAVYKQLEGKGIDDLRKEVTVLPVQANLNEQGETEGKLSVLFKGEEQLLSFWIDDEKAVVVTV